MNNELKSVAARVVRKSREALRDLERRVESSRLRYIANAPAGTVIPKQMGFYDDKSRKDAVDHLEIVRRELTSNLSDAVNHVTSKRADPPTDEALRLITALRGRNNVEAEELLAADSRFGENYSVHKSLHEIAEKNKLYGLIPDNESDEVETMNRNVRNLINSLTVEEFESGKLTDGSIAFQGAFLGVTTEE